MTKVLIVDTETTGFKADTSQAIQVGAVVFDTSTLRVIDEFTETVQFDAQAYQWSSGAEQVHGLSRATLANATPFGVGATRFVNFVEKYFPDGITLVCHNVRFDTPFVAQWYARAGADCKIVKTVDTMPIAQHYFGQRKLDVVFHAMQVQRGDHDALEDVMACVWLLQKYLSDGNTL